MIGKDLNETKHPSEMLNEQIATVTDSKVWRGRKERRLNLNQF